MRKKTNSGRKPKRCNERTLQMKKDHVRCWDNGMSVAEIAKKYSLNKRTVYNHLREIAEEAGRPIETLMSRPRHCYRDDPDYSGVKCYKDHQMLLDFANNLPDIKGKYQKIDEYFGTFFDAPWEEVLPESKEEIK